MKHKVSATLGLIIVMMSPLAISRVDAQTVAPGPYYANPSWDQTLACTALANCPRFIVLSNMNSEAVLDRETGLVWERSPSTSQFLFANEQATLHCNTLALGNRRGWRLPSLQELASLVDADPANTNSPRLPPGHPFQNIQSGMDAAYWSANQAGLGNGIVGTQFAWGVFMGNGFSFTDAALDAHFVWCVHGGKGLDIQ